MAAVIRWNYGRLRDVVGVIVERSPDFSGGVWTVLAEVESPLVEYVDDPGVVGSWYRTRVVQSSGVTAEPLDFIVDIAQAARADLVPGSETVHSAGAGPCTKDVDYTINYLTGEVTRIDGGKIEEDDDSIVISYLYRVVGLPTIPRRVEDVPICKVYGLLRSPTGAPVGDEPIYVSIERPPQVRGTHILISAPLIVRSDAAGYFEISLYQTAVVRVESTRAGLDKKFVVPSVDAKDFSTILLEA